MFFKLDIYIYWKYYKFKYKKINLGNNLNRNGRIIKIKYIYPIIK